MNQMSAITEGNQTTMMHRNKWHQLKKTGELVCNLTPTRNIKYFFCVGGEGGGKLQNEQEKWMTELYGNDPFQALMIQQQILLMQNPCTNLEGPLQGHSVQRQNRQWNSKSFIIQFSNSSQTAKQQNSLPALKIT